jgi:two-component system sensor kinase FixL
MPDEPADPAAVLPRIHEDDRSQAVALLDEILKSKTGQSWENTFRVVRPDGSVAWVQSRGRAERDADGRVTRLTGLELDFTRHHDAEQALQARRDEEHHRALRLLLETAHQGIVSVDAHGTIITANPMLEEMFGWEHGELNG